MNAPSPALGPLAGQNHPLADHGIRLRRETPGEHRTASPRCAEAKHRPRDDALAVKLEPDGGATWTCHRCNWKGGLPAPGRERRKPVVDQRQVFTRPPQAPADIPVVAARLWASRRPIEP